MNANKIVLNDEVLVDLTQDTVAEEDVTQGKTFHKADGSPATGTSTAIVPSGTLDVTANGTYDVKEYENVAVEVSGGGGDDETLNALLDGTLTEISSGKIAEIGPYKFYNMSHLHSVSFPNVTTIDKYAFDGCGVLSNANFPNVQTIQTYAFQNCSSLSEINCPRVTTINTYAFKATGLENVSMDNTTTLAGAAFISCESLISANFPKVEKLQDNLFSGCKSLTTVQFPNATESGSSVFHGCSSLPEINLPKLKTIAGYFCRECSALTKVNLPHLQKITGQFSMGYCTSLTDIDLHKADTLNYTFYECCNLEKVSSLALKSIYNSSFRNCYSLTQLILRGSTVTKLNNTDSFSGACHYHGTVNETYNPDGLKDGYIYVPKNLIENYKVATNWSTFADQFRSIEDYPEICGVNNYDFDSAVPVNSPTASVNCNAGDLIIVAIRYYQSMTVNLSEDWNLISNSDIFGGIRLSLYYKYADSEQESITLDMPYADYGTCLMIALKGATGFTENGYHYSTGLNSSAGITIERPQGMVLWITGNSSYYKSSLCKTDNNSTTLQDAYYTNAMMVLDQTGEETVTLFPSQSCSSIVNSLTIHGMDTFETWR